MVRDLFNLKKPAQELAYKVTGIFNYNLHLQKQYNKEFEHAKLTYLRSVRTKS